MSKPAHELENELRASRKKMQFFQGLSIVLALTALGVAGFYFKKGHFKEKPFDTKAARTAPHYDEIMAIVQPLEYSFMPVLSQRNVSISVDFKKNLWFLHNIHLFDPQGQVTLADGRYGLCGDLAAYTSQKITPLVDDKYKVRFVRAAESHFFPAPLNVHFVLSIINKTNPQEIYILDPSFKRYGPLDRFDDYLFFEHIHSLQFMIQKSRDNMELINRAVPVLIRNDVKLSLIVVPQNDRFDAQNFAVGIMTTHKNMYMPRTVYKRVMNAGKRETRIKDEEDAFLRKNVSEYAELITIAERFFEQIAKSR